MNLLFLQFDGSLNKILSTDLSRMADDIVVGDNFGFIGIVDGSDRARARKWICI